MAVEDMAVNSIKSILANFDDRYKKRVLRYLYRSVRKMKKDLKKRR